MTKWILNCQKSHYDWNSNKEYLMCPFCRKSVEKGSYHMGRWEKIYECGTVIKGDSDNEKYHVEYFYNNCGREGAYNKKNVIGRVLTIGIKNKR